MSSSSSKLTRRTFLKLGGAAAGGALIGGVTLPWVRRVDQPRANVMVLKAESYEQELADLLLRGISQYPQIVKRARGGRVVLKPNIVDHYAAHPVNTHPLIVAAVAAAFYRLGAAEVIVAEGPGHRRDSEMLLELSGFDDVLRAAKLPYVDLNLDAVSPVSLSADYTGLKRMFFPRTILGADLIVSMPKLKTHHWSGVTLSLKNMFGVVPGVKYGWPKNILHWRGITQSIVDIYNAVRPGFAIVDGIEGMEGDGPLHGDVTKSGHVVMGENLTAVDATAARLMGVYPERIDYLVHMMRFGGTVNAHRIYQIGENTSELAQDFAVMKHMAHIKQPIPRIKQWLLLGL
ncbi:MAG: DUF362 domain-containing protein [Anaerolineae bacterium]